MNSSVRRASAFALVATLAISAPVIGALVAVPFALIAVIGRVVSEGHVFELFARPSDRYAGELRGLIGFALAATALAVLSVLTGLPTIVFVATVLILGYGNLGERIACVDADDPFRRAVGFTAGGSLLPAGALVGLAAVTAFSVAAPVAALLSIAGALVGSLARAVLAERDDPLVMALIAATLWLLVALDVPVTATRIAVAVAIGGSFGYLSWRLDTASVTGMLTGVFISLLIIVLGGYGWFAVLIAFFGFGGLVSKYRYEEKREMGVAEENEGARSVRNVLGNAAVALASVIGFAASSRLGVDPALFTFAFAGSLATAMSDTVSSEIGVLFGPPRLITTGERVEEGTDGGVTVLGSLAGLTGAIAVAAVAVAALDIGPLGAAVIAVSGLLGMLADSLLGAVLEGKLLENQGVNFLATLVGAALSVVGALAIAIAAA